MIQDLFKNLFQADYTIAPECPWYEAQQNFGAPNIKWCEQTICSAINEPANAYSNIAYIIIAIMIFLHASKSKKKYLNYLGPIVFFMGTCSFLYHATNNAFSQFLDFFGMYFYVSLFVVLNLFRAKIIQKSQMLGTYIFLILLNISFFFVFPKIGIPIQFIIVVDTIFIFGTEAKAYLTKQSPIVYTQLVLGAFFMLLAQVSSQLDLHRIMCDPENHFIQGHAVWHLLSATSAWFTYKFYTQFNFEN